MHFMSVCVAFFAEPLSASLGLIVDSGVVP